MILMQFHSNQAPQLIKTAQKPENTEHAKITLIVYPSYKDEHFYKAFWTDE